MWIEPSHAILPILLIPLFSMLYVYIRPYYLKSAVVIVSSLATLFFTVELGIVISWSGTERYLIGGW
ncbi:MAG: hypothetical protein WD595_04710, partial [Waddliaceae bacterium]